MWRSKKTKNVNYKQENNQSMKTPRNMIDDRLTKKYFKIGLINMFHYLKENINIIKRKMETDFKMKLLEWKNITPK